MNKVFTINLGGYAFTIDEDAYAYLNDYMGAIHAHFRKSEGYEDITSDIESRMAELIHHSLGARTIVGLKEIKSAVSIMGTPEDFGAEPMDQFSEGATTEGQKSQKEQGDIGIKPGKRLMRNPEDKIVGGVCSGIASYFGIQDPVWVRLVFVAAFLLAGSGILLYLILCAILKEAKTPADFLAMRGEPINVQNIAKYVENELTDLSDRIKDEIDGGKSFKKKKKDMSGIVENPSYQESQGPFAKFLSVLRR